MMQGHRLLLTTCVLLFAVAHGWIGLTSPRTATSRIRLNAASSTPSYRPLATAVKHTLISVLAFAQVAGARPEGVNRPELLPKEANVPLIDVANFLTKGQEKKVVTDLTDLEKRTGYKLRVLCQSYPNTPGLAIKNYWGVDDNTVVLVVDKGEGFNKQGIPSNIMNLNIGKNADDALPGQVTYEQLLSLSFPRSLLTLPLSLPRLPSFGNAW